MSISAQSASSGSTPDGSVKDYVVSFCNEQLKMSTLAGILRTF